MRWRTKRRSLGGVVSDDPFEEEKDDKPVSPPPPPPIQRVPTKRKFEELGEEDEEGHEEEEEWTSPEAKLRWWVDKYRKAVIGDSRFLDREVIYAIETFPVEQVTSLEGLFETMFFKWPLDLSGWADKLGNVTTVRRVFASSFPLDSLTGIYSWKLPAVEDASEAFMHSKALKFIKIEWFQTLEKQRVNLTNMFANIQSVANIHLYIPDATQNTKINITDILGTEIENNLQLRILSTGEDKTVDWKCFEPHLPTFLEKYIAHVKMSFKKHRPENTTNEDLLKYFHGKMAETNCSAYFRYIFAPSIDIASYTNLSDLFNFELVPVVRTEDDEIWDPDEDDEWDYTWLKYLDWDVSNATVIDGYLSNSYTYAITEVHDNLLIFKNIQSAKNAFYNSMMFPIAITDGSAFSHIDMTRMYAFDEEVLEEEIHTKGFWDLYFRRPGLPFKMFNSTNFRVRAKTLSIDATEFMTGRVCAHVHYDGMPYFVSDFYDCLLRGNTTNMFANVHHLSSLHLRYMYNHLKTKYGGTARAGAEPWHHPILATENIEQMDRELASFRVSYSTPPQNMVRISSSGYHGCLVLDEENETILTYNQEDRIVDLSQVRYIEIAPDNTKGCTNSIQPYATERSFIHEMKRFKDKLHFSDLYDISNKKNLFLNLLMKYVRKEMVEADSFSDDNVFYRSEVITNDSVEMVKELTLNGSELFPGFYMDYFFDDDDTMNKVQTRRLFPLLDFRYDFTMSMIVSYLLGKAKISKQEQDRILADKYPYLVDCRPCVGSYVPDKLFQGSYLLRSPSSLMTMLTFQNIKKEMYSMDMYRYYLLQSMPLVSNQRVVIELEISCNTFCQHDDRKYSRKVKSIMKNVNSYGPGNTPRSTGTDMFYFRKSPKGNVALLAARPHGLRRSVRMRRKASK